MNTVVRWLAGIIMLAGGMLAGRGETAHPDLSGRVTDVGGKALDEAHVYTYTGKPKSGPA